METTMIHARVPANLKADAEKVLDKLGLSMSEVIRAMLAQIKLQKAIPFEIIISKNKMEKVTKKKY